MKRLASLVSVVLFWLMAAVHVVRMAVGAQLTLMLGDWRFEVPLWVSVLPVVFFGAMGAWLWMERQVGS